MGRARSVLPRAFGLEANIMERAVGVLLGILAGLFVGLVAVVLGTLAGRMPPDTPDRCVGLMVTPPVVGALCGGFLSWRLGKSGPPERRGRKHRRW